jgi:phosphate transport system protein
VDTARGERDEDLEALLIEMARTVGNIFSEGLDIFKNHDIERARELQARDDKVDLLYSEALNLVANPSAGGAGAPEWRMRAALIVHYLERIADHGVDIGACTVFLVTGERIEDAMQQYLEHDLDEE